MKFFLPFLICLLVGCDVAAPKQSVLAITHVNVIDATGAGVKPDSMVLLEGDRITALGNSSTVHPPTDAVVVDATGKYLIPGLWDMHVHWYQENYLPLFIANGVTGVRMMWGYPIHHAWKKQIERGSLLGPRMYLASTLVDGPNPIWPGSFVASSATEGREAVKQAKADKADFVKVYSLLPRDAYFAIADEARKLQIPFAGHVPISVTAEEAAAAGQMSIEHLTGILPACSSREAELLKAAQNFLAENATNNAARAYMAHAMRENKIALETYSADKAAALFSALKQNGTWQCPTFTVLRLFTLATNPAITNDARLKYMPPEMRSEWNGMTSSRLKNSSAKYAALGEAYFQKHLEIVGAMQHAGVSILAGTDTGNPYCMPGFSLHDELAFLVQAGLTPMEALQAATLNAARFMGREKDLGTITTGKLADLVLLDANPLDDIANTRKIAAVIYNGKMFPRTSLDEMLNKVKTLASTAEPGAQPNDHETRTGFHLN
jgi:imidazolonepropionase-like amidohydrolase